MGWFLKRFFKQFFVLFFCVFGLKSIYAKENIEKRLGFSFPYLTQVSAQVSSGWGLGVGVFPLGPLVRGVAGGFERAWSDEISLWIEPEALVFSSFIFYDWPFGGDVEGVRPEWTLRTGVSLFFWQGGGRISARSKESGVQSPLINISGQWAQSNFDVFAVWRPWESRDLEFFAGIGIRAAQKFTIQSSGSVASLLDLNADYREAFSQGLEQAEAELTQNVSEAGGAMPWVLPALGMTFIW